MEQLSIFPAPQKGAGRTSSQEKKRRWETAFQRWSNEKCSDPVTPQGSCGYGSMCDWCNDNSYGRPCVRALNAMCREKNLTIDYDDRDFSRIWYGKE